VCDGIQIYSTANVAIGGSSITARNVISGNLNGVYMKDSRVIQLVNNFIGLKYTGVGKPSIANNYGVYGEGLNLAITIGGDSATLRNFVSGNYQAGIYGTFYNSFIQGNYIGLDKLGDSLGNGSYGIYLVAASSNNLIGGDLPGEANVIADNVQDA